MNNYFKIFLFITLTMLLSQCSEDRIDGTETGTITGKVVKDVDNTPLANVKITTQPVTSTVFSDEMGNFEIENVPVGSYSVKADLDDFLSGFEPANVIADAEVNVVFELFISDENNSQPSAFELITPANNSVDLSTTVEFAWFQSIDEDENDEVIYNLKLYNDTDSEILDFQNITDTIYTVEDLRFGTKYFWQVSASDNSNPPVFSSLFNFETTTSPQLDILFVREENSNNVIYSTDQDGNEFRLTSPSVNSFRPRRNSVTNKIAFLRNVGGNVHIFTMDEDGSNQVQVTSSQPIQGFNFEELDFTWSPQGDFLLYPAFSTLYKIASNGTGLEDFYIEMNGNFVTEVDWSRFNDVIAVKTNNSQGYNVEIFTINTDGDVQETILSGITGGAGGLNLNVDGTKVLYYQDISGIQLPEYSLQDARLFIWDIPTMSRFDLMTSVTEGFLNIDPRFSPNENLVIYTEKGRAFGAPSKVLSHNFALTDQNFEIITENGKMPDWEN
ncbi:MAG: carboxypeptidase regulatory-like domain-containing protein [Patiriisocius sp.]|uniref:carboxypeptidase regulatory-like domain-containing protein n=1 Tax=Patiriisocius sp. TaxID=2822396 RepID=UPI003EF788B3